MGIFDTIWSHYKFGGGYTEAEKQAFQQDLFNNYPGVGVAVIGATGFEAQHPEIVNAITTLGEPIAKVVQTGTDVISDAYWFLKNPLVLGGIIIGALIIVKKI